MKRPSHHHTRMDEQQLSWPGCGAVFDSVCWTFSEFEELGVDELLTRPS
jgi:hypothetical protein